MFYYLFYNSSFSFIVENRLFSTVLYGSIIYILSHAVLNYCDIPILNIINHYYWTIFALDIISFIYSVYLNQSNSKDSELNVSFNLLKNKINTMIDRKNDLTITHIPSTSNKDNFDNDTNNDTNTYNSYTKSQTNSQPIMQPRYQTQLKSYSSNTIDEIDELEKLNRIEDLNILDDSSPTISGEYSTPIKQLQNKNNKNNNNTNNKNTNNNNNSMNRKNMNMSNTNKESTPINLIRKNVIIEEPIVNDYQFNSGESVAGSDVGSVMDLADFENSL